MLQEREEKEEKKKEADAESAKIYEQFVQSFGVGGADEGKTFLRGGVAGGPTLRGSRLSAPASGPAGIGGAGAGSGLGTYGPGSGGMGAGSAAVAMPLALAGYVTPRFMFYALPFLFACRSCRLFPLFCSCFFN